MSNQATTTTTSLFAEVTRPPNMAGVLRVKFIGPSLGEREVGIICELVRTAIEKAVPGLKHLVLDMTSITFMNSMALGMCIDFRTRASKAGAKAVFIGLNQQLSDLLKMVKVEKLYTIVRSEDELRSLVGA